MNKNIDKFDNFLLERSRAEKKLKRAEKKLRKAKEHSEEGKDERAEREIEKAKELLAKAKELDPKIDIAEVESDIAEVEEVDWKEEFDITTSFLGKRVKSDDFDYIKKIKIVGNEISPEEVILFLNSVRTYINQNWDDIKDGDGKEEYRSTHNDKMVIDVNNKSKKITFTYKEKGGIFVDKAKLEIDKEVFEDKENRDKMSDELDKLIGTKALTDKEESRVADKYREDKDKDKKILAVATGADVIANTARNISEDPEIKKEVEELKTPDSSFISDSVELLINEKLNIGMSNTDEEKIFNWFVTNNSKKTVNPKNIDSILIDYKKKKALMNESAISRAWNSVTDTESKGVVQDLMNAFNTDATTVSKDINSMLRKMANAYSEELSKKVEDVKKDAEENPDKYVKLSESILNEEIDAFDAIETATVGGTGYAVGKKIANKKGISGLSSDALKNKAFKREAQERLIKQKVESDMKKRMANKTLSKSAEKSLRDKLTKRYSRKILGRTATKVVGKQILKTGAKRMLIGRLLGGGASLIGLGSNPVGWVVLAVIASAATWYYLYNTFDKQQHQIAHIFLLMWSSQSPKFLQEMKRAGIRIDDKIKPNLDNLKGILSEPIVDTEDTEDIESEMESETNEGRKYVKTFESMYPVDKDTKTAYNTAMFNMSVTDEEENIVFNENVESDKIKELKKDFKEKGYKIAIKKAKDEKDEK